MSGTVDTNHSFGQTNPSPKKLAGTEGGGSLPDARRFTHHPRGERHWVAGRMVSYKIDKTTS